MTHDLSVWAFETHEVRTIERDGDPWWVLADVCRVLEHSNPTMAAQALDHDEKALSIVDTPGGQQEMLIVNEPGLYKLIGTSRKPQAKRFDRWVRHEVLPSIRKTGSYGSQVPVVAQQIVDGLKEALRPLAIRFDGQDAAIERLENGQEYLKEEVVSIKKHLLGRRKEITPSTKGEHIRAIELTHGGLCPCGCGQLIVRNGIKLNAEFDHMYASSKPDADHTWPLAKSCHADLTAGRMQRHEIEPAFKAYQRARKLLSGAQMKMFDI